MENEFGHVVLSRCVQPITVRNHVDGAYLVGLVEKWFGYADAVQSSLCTAIQRHFGECASAGEYARVYADWLKDKYKCNDFAVIFFNK